MKDIKTNLKNTIDLRSIIENERDKKLIKNGYLQDFNILEKFMIRFQRISKVMVIMGVIFTLLLVMYPFNETNANESNVLSIRDKIRLERINICNEYFQKYKNIKNVPMFVRNKTAVVSCAIRMHWVYIMESWSGQSEMCKKRNSCLWIKSKVNWYYGHNKFSSYNEERRIFADKYFKYHFKKSPFTFIYWYKQTNWKYKWGWATWNRVVYVSHLNKIENDEKLISEYSYLYMTWRSK